MSVTTREKKMALLVFVVCSLLLLLNMGMLLFNAKMMKSIQDTIVEITNKPEPKPEVIAQIVDPFELSKDMEILSSYIQSRNNRIAVEIADRIAWEIHNQAELQNMEIGVICGVIETESTWNPFATSPKGAKGLMQILKEDGVEIDPKCAYDLRYNIQKGVEILKSKLQKSKGNLDLALHWYVGKEDGYTEKVFKHMNRYVAYKTRIATTEENVDRTDEATGESV